MSEGHRIRVQVLGRTRVKGRDVTGQTQARVLCVLAMHVDKDVLSDQLLEYCWTEGRRPKTAQRALSTPMSRLRKFLGLSKEQLAGSTGAYRLDEQHVEVDAREFEKLADKAKQAFDSGKPGQALLHVTDALRLWEGAPYGPVSSFEWAKPFIESLRGIYLDVVDLKAEILLRGYGGPITIAELARAAEEDPFRESTWCYLAHAHYRANHQQRALRVLQTLRSRLADELGVDPSARVQALQDRILRQDPSLLANATPVRDEETSSSKARLLHVDRPARSSQFHADDEDLHRFLASDPFFGRDPDVMVRYRMASDVADGGVPQYVIRDLDQDLRALLADPAQRLVAVAGRPKTGKTRTLLECLAIVSSDAMIFPVGRVLGTDAIWHVARAVAENPPTTPWILFVDDLHLHLGSDGRFDANANIAAAVRKVGESRTPGKIVATFHRKVLDLPEETCRLLALSVESQELLSGALSLPDELTPTEVTRSEPAFPALSADERRHLPERLAAVPQLRRRAREAFADQPEHSARVAMLLSACQLSIADDALLVNRDALRARSKSLHRFLAPRRIVQLTENDLDAAERWATEVIGAAFAILTPVQGSDADLELLETIRVDYLEAAVNPIFAVCENDSRRLIRLGSAAQDIRGPADAQQFFRRGVSNADELAAEAEHGLAHCLMDLDKTREAAESFRKAIQSSDPAASAAAAKCLGYCLQGLGDTGGAKAAFQLAIDSGHAEWRPRALHGLAHVLVEEGHIDAARNAFEDAASCEIEEIAAAAALCMGLALLKAHREYARHGLELAVRIDHPKHTARAASLLAAMLEEGDPSGAKSLYEIGLKSASGTESDELRIAYGLLLCQLGELDTGELQLRSALDSDSPRQADRAAFHLGAQLVKQDRAREAEPFLRRVMASSEGDYAGLAGLMLATIIEKKGDLEGSLRVLEEVIALKLPDHSGQAGLRLARRLQEKGDSEGAKVCYLNVFDMETADQIVATSALELGEVLKAMEDAEGAIAALRRAIATKHKELAPHAAYAVGDLLLAKGDEEEAIAAFEAARDSGHPYLAPLASFRLGVLWETRGDDEAAIAAFNFVVERGDESLAPGAAHQLGHVQWKSGKADEACEAFKRARESSDPELATNGSFDLAEAHLESHEIEDARDALRWIIRNQVNSPQRMHDLGHAFAALGDMTGSQEAFTAAELALPEGTVLNWGECAAAALAALAPPSSRRRSPRRKGRDAP